MKALIALGGLIVGAFGLYRYWEWLSTPLEWQPTYLAVPACIPIVGLISYATLLTIRARQPKLEVGELVPDDSRGSHSFHVKVKNLGPGNVTPTVTITHLKDETGRNLPGVRESYQSLEAHWRGATTPNWNPDLKKGEPGYAGVLDVEEIDTETPYLCTYPNELCAPRRLWGEPRRLENQKSIQLSILISYRSSKDVKGIERSYRVTPDKNAPLRYKIERVKKFV